MKKYGWDDVASVPKDGREIIVFWKSKYKGDDYKGIAVGQWDEDAEDIHLPEEDRYLDAGPALEVYWSEVPKEKDKR